MDRDKRNERIELAYNAFTQGAGQTVAAADLLAVCFCYVHEIESYMQEHIESRADAVNQTDKS